MFLRLIEKKMDGPDNYVICGSQSDSRSEIVVSKEQEDYNKARRKYLLDYDKSIRYSYP